jgi:hypothetical protein
LRHTVYIGTREDKLAVDVRREAATSGAGDSTPEPLIDRLAPIVDAHRASPRTVGEPFEL